MSIKAFNLFLLLNTLSIGFSLGTVIAYYASGGATFRTMPNEIVLMLAAGVMLSLIAVFVIIYSVKKTEIDPLK